MEKISNCLDIIESYYIYEIKKNLTQLRSTAEINDIDRFLEKFKEYKDSLSSLNLIQQMKSNTAEFLKEKENGN
jgi:hypothetical protein